jgi:hypothetical protein
MMGSRASDCTEQQSRSCDGEVANAGLGFIAAVNHLRCPGERMGLEKIHDAILMY